MFKNLVLTLSSIILLSACSKSLNSSIEYYQFQQPITATQRTAEGTKAQLRIATVQLRGALNNRGIAMELDKNRINAANYHLWGSAPDQMLTASAQQTLYTSLPNWLVVKGFPVITSESQQSYYELEYELEHFNGNEQGQAIIAGQWRLFYHSPTTGRQLKSVNYFKQEQNLQADDYQGLVAALETAWQTVNQQVSQEIIKITLN